MFDNTILHQLQASRLDLNGTTGTGNTPLDNGDGDINCTVFTLNWVEFGITTLVIMLRLVAQMKVLRRLSADDILICLAWVCTMQSPGGELAPVWDQKLISGCTSM